MGLNINYYNMPTEKLLFLAELNTSLKTFLNIQNQTIKVYRSKGLLAHLIKRKHYRAAKYIDFLPEIILNPDYAGINNEQIELIKCFKDNIFLSIKLDKTKGIYYVSTVFDVNQAKINYYCKSGRLKKISKS